MLVINMFGLLSIASAITKSADENSNSVSQNIRPEHIAFNVSDPVAQAKWLSDNLGMKIIRRTGAPTFTTFIANADVNMMMELFKNDNYPKLDLPKISYMAIHFAFMTDDINKTKNKLLASKATVAEDITTTTAGDNVLMMRDPWGLPLQFVQRAKPMLQFEQYRPEHFAVNISNPVEKAKWFADNLGMKIMRQGGAPAYGTFIADSKENMMLELYNNTNFPMLDFPNTSHMAIHVAFMVDDINVIKAKLISAGATLVEDITKTPAGDLVLMLRDPWGEPIQFVKRAVPMLK
jgi:uncharacterized glyoxalase superfamily protein PhnB